MSGEHAAGPAAAVAATVDAVYRAESRRVLATLIRLLGDFDAAEEALHDAFVAAVERWPRDGVPDNPRAWLLTVVRNTCFSLRGTQAGIHLEEFDETSAEHDAAGQANGSTDPAAISQRSW